MEGRYKVGTEIPLDIEATKKKVRDWADEQKAALRTALELDNTEYDYGHNVCHQSEE